MILGIGCLCCHAYKTKFHALPKQEQEETALDDKIDIVDFVDTIYDHFEEFELLINCSKGSSYENYLDELVEIVVASITRFMQGNGHEAVICGKKAPPELIYMLVSSNLYGYFEPVTHGMSQTATELTDGLLTGIAAVLLLAVYD